MAKTLAETIKEITKEHLTKNNGLLLGQAITAVGFVNNTVPDCKNIIELSMADVAGAGIAVGTAVAGRRPIFILRFQDFLFLNGSMLVNYAAKTKDMFQKSTPIFVRAIATEGHGAGPVHSGKLHATFMHYPGFRVFSPMTPKEYEYAWNDFMSHDDPMIVSEHRISFQNSDEMDDIIKPDAQITLLGISAARINVYQAAEELEAQGVSTNVINISQLKPVALKQEWVEAVNASANAIVVDSGFEIAGASQVFAYELMFQTGKKVKALGLFDKSVGVSKETENLTPSKERIIETSLNLLKNNE